MLISLACGWWRAHASSTLRWMRALTVSNSAGISYCREPVRWKVVTWKMRATLGAAANSRSQVSRSARSPSVRSMAA